MTTSADTNGTVNFPTLEGCFERTFHEGVAQYPTLGTVNLSRLFNLMAQERVRVEARGGKVPPWRTLRGWAADALTARREDRPLPDLEQRWLYAQRRVTGLCSKGKHRLTTENLYHRKVRDKRTKTGWALTSRCKACHAEAVKRAAHPLRKRAALFTPEDAALVGTLMLTRSDAWLGSRIKSFLLQLIKTELVPKE